MFVLTPPGHAVAIVMLASCHGNCVDQSMSADPCQPTSSFAAPDSSRSFSSGIHSCAWKRPPMERKWRHVKNKNKKSPQVCQTRLRNTARCYGKPQHSPDQPDLICMNTRWVWQVVFGHVEQDAIVCSK